MKSGSKNSLAMLFFVLLAFFCLYLSNYLTLPARGVIRWVALGVVLVPIVRLGILVWQRNRLDREELELELLKLE